MNLKDVLNSVANDVVTLVRQEGTRTENVKAVVQSNEITIFDTSLNVEVGDRIERRLPSGRVESYSVLDTGFNPGTALFLPFTRSRYAKNRRFVTIGEAPR